MFEAYVAFIVLLCGCVAHRGLQRVGLARPFRCLLGFHAVDTDRIFTEVVNGTGFCTRCRHNYFVGH